MGDDPIAKAGAIEGSRALYLRVRGAFVARGQHFTGWCRAHSIDRKYAEHCLKGDYDGPGARLLRRRIVDAAGLARRNEQAA